MTAVTVACADRELGNALLELLASTNFRALYTSDVVGVEVGGAVKNVIAIAAGMSEGLGLGTNAMAALVTRGCTEMRRLVQVWHPDLIRPPHRSPPLTPLNSDGTLP